MAISHGVRALRRAREWSRKELAQRAGVSLVTIERIENGRHQPQEQTRWKLARAFGVSDDELEAGGPAGPAVGNGSAELSQALPSEASAPRTSRRIAREASA
jgi:transcriptional regulator with XRE-family HTH domain